MFDLISNNRLDSYAPVLKTKNRAESLRAYYWNKALAASLYPAIQCLEVTLRNAIDRAIKNNPPQQNMYAVNDWWFKNLAIYIGNKKFPAADRFHSNGSIKKFTWEEQQITKVTKGFINKNVSYNSSKIIAGLDFGFWTNLLSTSYVDTGSSTLLWPNLLADVFPNAPATIQLADIRSKMDRVREFRNRISHHEPVWKFYYLHPGTLKPDYAKPVFGRAASIGLLTKQFEEILELIEWIDHDRAIYLKSSKVCDPFLRICNEGGFQAYLSPKNMQTIEMKKTTKIRTFVRKIRKNEIFSVTRNKTIGAIVGADIPLV